MTHLPGKQKTVDERDSRRQAGDLAAMRRMLVVSEGCFSLSIAVCDDRTLRNELIDRMREEFPGLLVVRLAAETADVYRTVCDQLPVESPRGIFVLELEASVPCEAITYPTLRSLNSSRELWERLKCPIVFWLAEYAAAIMARYAPDFWRYKSHQFEFISERQKVGKAVREPFPGFDMIDGLPFEEKRFRVAELEKRLNEAGMPPSGDLLPHALLWLYELARLYQHANQFDCAHELLERAVSWTETAYGPQDPHTAVALNKLAHLLRETNRFVGAEPLLRRAVAIEEQNFGKDNPSLAAALNNLALLLLDTNRLTEAELLMRRALAMDEQSFGRDHPTVANRLNNLAVLLRETKRLAEAEFLMRRALAVDEQSLGKDHPHVATDCSNLAQLLEATSRLAEAEPLMRRALSIDEKAFSMDHPEVAKDLNNLAQLLQATNRLVEAEPLMRHALAINEQSLGKDHPKVAICLNNLAGLLFDTNRLAEAEPLMRRQLDILFNFTREIGHPHPHLQAAISNYELLLQQLGMKKEEIEQRLKEIKGRPLSGMPVEVTRTVS